MSKTSADALQPFSRMQRASTSRVELTNETTCHSPVRFDARIEVIIHLVVVVPNAVLCLCGHGIFQSKHNSVLDPPSRALGYF